MDYPSIQIRLEAAPCALSGRRARRGTGAGAGWSVGLAGRRTGRGRGAERPRRCL